MADRHILYRQRAALQGGFVGIAAETELLNTHVGVVEGANNVATAVQRIDATGVGATLFSFTGSYTAQGTNISEWFGNKQLNRLRCTGRGGSPSGSLPFSLPGATALGTAFDTLVTLGLEERITFVIEYTGTSESWVTIVPRDSGGSTPQIGGTSSIIVRTGVAATLEVTRTSGTISDYVFLSIGGIGNGGTIGGDAIKLINPSLAVWNANDGGTLPENGVVKGNAYRVANAPADGSGRFGEVMQDLDWVVWTGETFTAWATEPHAWIVIPSHDVRRITALEVEFLNDVQTSPVSDRNSVIRAADPYADSVGEIRLKIYAQRSNYSAADLNTTGDIDEFTDPSDTTGYLGIRLSGNQAALASTLPTLYVYAINGSTFTKILNLDRDFSFEGDFGAESDYLSTEAINYGGGTTLRIYVGTEVDRFQAPNLDITEENLVPSVQAKLNRTDGNSNVDEQRLQAVESKVSALFPLTPDVTKLTEWAAIFTPDNSAQQVVETAGYSLMIDYRGAGDRYQSSGVTYDDTGANVVTYTGLTDDYHRFFGFGVSAPADQVLLWIVDGATRIPYVDMTLAGNFRINNYTTETTDGEPVSNQSHFLTRTAGDEFVSTAADSLSTFTITNFPAGATNTSRTLQIETDVALNGTDTQAGHILDIPLPAANTAQDRQTVTSSIYLGPLYGNRTVNVTVAYELRVSGSDLLIDLYITSAPSDVTIRFADVATFLSYVPAATTTRVDNYVVVQDAGGDFTFTGAAEFAFALHPYSATNTMLTVPAVLNEGTVTLLNDVTTRMPSHGFASVEIPDTIEFRSAITDHFLLHNDFNSLLPREATKWVYGLALLQTITDYEITSEIEIDSFVMTATPNNTKIRVTMDDTTPGSPKFNLTELP